MRIIVTCDLHYNVQRSKGPTQAIAREICDRGGDVLLIVGDSAAINLSVLDELMALFDDWRGPKLLVAGNHELWTVGGACSLRRYQNELAEACARNGVHYLDAEPFRANGTAIVGNVGWYDFTFRPSLMRIPLRFYQHKVAPGAARELPKHQHLLENSEDVPEPSMEIGSRWMDGERVKLPMGDVDFTQHTIGTLRGHLESCSDADRVVVGIHHLPFAELIPHSVIPNWEFATGFLGSELIGETLLEYENVRHVFCGHSHNPARCSKQQIECINVGSTYREKRFEVLDV